MQWRYWILTVSAAAAIKKGRHLASLLFKCVFCPTPEHYYQMVILSPAIILNRIVL